MYKILNKISIYKKEVLCLSLEMRKLGMTGFEPATFCTQNKRATKLRYIPTFVINYILVRFFMKEKKIIYFS